jgi:hypothetical protein
MMKPDEFYITDGLYVFTERYHLRRQRCCGNGCRHCPYEHREVPEEKKANLLPPYPYFGGPNAKFD